MGFLKSKEQKRIERNLKIRQGIRHMQKQVGILKKNEINYLEKARRAKQLGDQRQFLFLRNTFKQTYGQRVALERQLLAIETAVQMKNQAESHAKFAEALNAVSLSIADAFKSADLVRTQQQFESAILKAQTMEEVMETFLEMTSDSVSASAESYEELISDGDVDRMLEATSEDEIEEISTKIQQGIKDIEKELNK